MSDPWNDMFGRRTVGSPSGCWLWTGAVRPTGYGRLTVKGRYWYAHRLSYAIAVGAIPEGMTVDHLCFTPLCLRPDHLQLLTHSENVNRRLPNRKAFCKSGHPMFGSNIYIRPDRGEGKNRECRACRDQRRVAYLQKKRGVAA